VADMNSDELPFCQKGLGFSELTTSFTRKEEKKTEIIPSSEMGFFFPLNERPRQTRHILCHGLSLMTSSW